MTTAKDVRLSPAVGWLLTFGAGFMPVFSLFWPLGLSPLFVVLGVGALLGWIFSRQWPPFDRSAMLWLGLFSVWTMVSSAWAPNSVYSFWQATRLAGETLCGLLLLAAVSALRPYQWRYLRHALLIGLSVALCLVSIDLALDNAIVKAIRGQSTLPIATNRTASVIVLCASPVLFSLWRDGHRWRAGGMALAILITILLLHSDAAKLALILALSVVGLGICFPALRRYYALAMRFGTIAFFLGMPLMLLLLPSATRLADQGVKASGVHRLLIWQFGVQRLIEKPAFGWGFEASRILPGGKGLVDIPQGHGEKISGEAMPLHPHNAPLQIWLELGGVGAGLMAVTLAIALKRAFALTHGFASLLATSGWCLASCVMACLSYGFWQSWWLSSLWLSLIWLRAALSEG